MEASKNAECGFDGGSKVPTHEPDARSRNTIVVPQSTLHGRMQSEVMVLALGAVNYHCEYESGVVAGGIVVIRLEVDQSIEIALTRRSTTHSASDDSIQSMYRAARNG